MEEHLPPTATRGPGHAPGRDSVAASEGVDGTPGALDDPRALQILSTEHWSLLAGRSLAWNEAFSRAGMFLSALSGAVVALALVGQGTQFGEGFVVTALILLPIVLLLGIATIIRLGQVNEEDLLYVQAMNRIRRAYLEIDPGLAPYFSTRSHDDIDSVMATFAVRPGANQVIHGLVTTPAMVTIICSVLTGIIAALVETRIAGGMAPTVGTGIVGFVVAWVALTAYGAQTFGGFYRSLEVRFPADGAGQAAGRTDEP